MKSTPVTATLIARIKREAKRRAKAESRPHTELLEELAREAGFASWFAARRGNTSLSLSALPVDPKMRAGFDSTRNEDRSKEELDQWWDRPFALSSPEGQFDVWCLDGGAWDRPTWYGVAGSLAAAERLSAEKLAKWREFRSRPWTHFEDDGTVTIVQMPQRPDGQQRILKANCSQEEANEFIRTFSGP
ncbi:hypothetical protein [Burkholderia lata]|uniref:hypothetical protein n=1 Tax=Burkholderia lata (strain ATCC 17760 / DSM 23089 / LMG 22485 / NCIMB 9086 / R18194 / 383) TaxID=482957 RepID=UPI0015833DA3|nr:hypothetical protein [Burkholderia lata]